MLLRLGEKAVLHQLLPSGRPLPGLENPFPGPGPVAPGQQDPRGLHPGLVRQFGGVLPVPDGPQGLGGGVQLRRILAFPRGFPGDPESGFLQLLLRVPEVSQRGVDRLRFLQPPFLQRLVPADQLQRGRGAEKRAGGQSDPGQPGQGDVDPPLPPVPDPVVFLFPDPLQPQGVLPGAPGVQLQPPLLLADLLFHRLPVVSGENQLFFPPAPGAVCLPVGVGPPAYAYP